MNLNEAIKAMYDGKLVRNQSWIDEDHLSMDNGVVIQNIEGKKSPYIFGLKTSMNGWEIYKKPRIIKDLKVGQRFIFEAQADYSCTYRIVQSMSGNKFILNETTSFFSAIELESYNTLVRPI